MSKHILTIAGAVTHTAEQLDDLGMQAVYAGGDDGAFAVLLDLLLHLFAGLLDGFLDLGGMYASVLNEVFERETRDLTADGIEAGDGDGLGGVVNDEIDAGLGFDGADVASLASDNASLHLIVGQRHDRDGSLGDVVGGAAHDRQRDILSGLLLRFLLELLLILRDADGFLVSELAVEGGEKLILGLFYREPGDALEHFQLPCLQLFGFFQVDVGLLHLVLKGLFLFLKIVELSVERFLFLLETVLLLLNSGAALAELTFIFLLELVYLVLCVDECFLLLGFGGLDRVRNDTLCLFLSGAELGFGNLASI